MKTHIDKDHCDICDKETKQKVTDSGHERDSSNDHKECLECGAYWSGWTGRWHKMDD